MITVEKVSKRFGRQRALRDISFDIDAGEVVGFVGQNGAGKTTCLRILAGFLAADSGRIVVGGLDLSGQRVMASRAIGYVPEGAPSYPDMRVEEYLRFRSRLKGASRSAAWARVDELIEQLGLSDRRRTLIARLSRGFRQRVGLADALVAKPKVLLLDEPTSGLDPIQVRELISIVTDTTPNVTCLWSSHTLAELEAVLGRLIVLAEGQVTADGSPEQLRKQAGLPDHADLAALLAAQKVDPA